MHASVEPRGRASAQLVRRLITGAVLGMLVVSTPVASARMQERSEQQSGSVSPAWVSEAQRLIEKHHCSTKGLGEGRIPTRAVVRVGEKVRTASFDVGWAMHQGTRPGTLLAVCPG